MKNDVFIETANVGKFRKAMSILSDTDRGQAGFCVVRGVAGRGKTVAAQEYHANSDSLFLRVFEGWNQFGFLQALSYELTGFRPSSTQRCRNKIMDTLGDDPQPIIVDEADRLTIQRIEDLRDIHDTTGCPIILIGEEGMLGMLNARERILSRVSHVVDFEGVTAADVMLFGREAAGLKVAPEAAVKLVALSKGCFRDIYTFMIALEEYAKAQGANDIDAQIIKKLKIGAKKCQSK